MNRTTICTLLLAFALPASALAAASSEESARLCPKGKPAVAAQEAETPAAPAVQGIPAAKPASGRSSGAPTARPATQRWHSVLPGMIR